MSPNPIMRRSKYILTALAAFLVSLSASAQSKSFSLGKWVELHNAILKELNRSYVDSLEVGCDVVGLGSLYRLCP